MSVRRAALAALEVRPEEGRLVSLLLAHSFFLGIPRTLTSTAAMALFLAVTDARNLPYVYIGAAVAIPLTGFVRLRVAGRVRLRRLLALDLAVVLAALLALRAGLAWPPAVLAVALVLPVWAEVEWVLLSLEFWGLAGQLLNVRQGKRLFGLVGSGELLAGTVSGLAIPGLVSLLGTANLLLVSAASVVVCQLFLRRLGRRLESASERVEHAAPSARAGSYAELLRNRYLGLLFALVALSYLGYYVVDNAFYNLAERHWPDADALASFLGVFWAVVALATLLGRALVSGRVLGRYGVVGGLVALPATIATGVLMVAVSGVVGDTLVVAFWLLAATKLLDQALRESVDRSAVLLLYQPLPSEQRVRAQTAVEGIVGPVAGGVAGVILLLVVTRLQFGAPQLATLTLGVATLWMSAAVLIRKEYAEALRQALARRRLTGDGITLDAHTLEVVERGLASDHPAEVSYCLTVLEDMEYAGLSEALVRLLEHPMQAVRRDALLRIERLVPRGTVEAVRACCDPDSPSEVRGAALRALAAVGESEDLERVLGHVDDPDTQIRRDAVVGLLRNGGIEGILQAGERVVRAARDLDPGRRAFAADVIGEVGVAGFYRPLVDLLRDGDPDVRRAALAAAGRLANPRLWPRVLESLREPRLRSAAVAAVVAAGAAIHEPLETAYAKAESSGDRVAMRRLARLLGQVPGERAQEFLWRKAAIPDPEVRSSVLASLAVRDFRASPGQLAVVEERIAAEVDQATGLLVAADDVRSEYEGPLTSTLRAAADRARERVLWLLAFVYPADSVHRARVSLTSRSPDTRAQAVELVDSLIPPQLSQIVVPLIEDLPDSIRLERLSARFSQRRCDPDERLRRIIRGDEPVGAWARACALHAAAETGRDGMRDAASATLRDPDPLVRETAAWAVARLGRDRRSDAGTETDSLIERFARSLGGRAPGAKPMLSTVEKVIILKSVSIFSETPDDVLAEVAQLLEEVEVEPGAAIIEKGDMGSSLYVVVDGRVRVHDGDRTLRELGPREIFGEMAALDPEPRSASVTAIGQTHLFRLEQEALYELMADRIEVVRGVIRVLCHRLRAWTR